MSSLLDLLREDLTAEALAKPAAPRPRWNEPNRWEFGGYLARVRIQHCRSCGDQTFWSLGVFSEEKCSNGTRRLTHAEQWPTGEKGRRMEYEYEGVDLCATCLDAHGFDTLIETPTALTNVAGQGLLGTKKGD